MKRFLIVTVCILLVCFTIGCSKSVEEENPSSDTGSGQDKQQPQFEQKEIVLFFPDTGDNFLLHEFRKITVEKDISTEDMIKLMLEELIKGTDNTELKSIMPRNTKVLSVQFEKGTATIDFTEDFLASDYSSREKLLQVYAVVNSICELGAEQINILTDGKPLIESYQSLKTQMPFIRNDELIPSK